jgi:valyl-tRNA synthetase
LARLESVHLEPAPAGAVRAFVAGVAFGLLLPAAELDTEQQDAARAKLDAELTRARRKLEDPVFLSRAPAAIVDGARAIVADLEAKLTRLSEGGDGR